MDQLPVQTPGWSHAAVIDTPTTREAVLILCTPTPLRHGRTRPSQPIGATSVYRHSPAHRPNIGPSAQPLRIRTPAHRHPCASAPPLHPSGFPPARRHPCPSAFLTPCMTRRLLARYKEVVQPGCSSNTVVTVTSRALFSTCHRLHRLLVCLIVRHGFVVLWSYCVLRTAYCVLRTACCVLLTESKTELAQGVGDWS